MSKQISVFDCAIVYLPQIGNRNGHITVVNTGVEIPFATKRVFYLYDLPGGGVERGTCTQGMPPVSGSGEWFF